VALEVRVRPPLGVKEVLDEPLLFAVERDDAERHRALATLGIAQARQHLGNQCPRLRAVHPRGPPLVEAVRDGHEAHRPVLGHRGREGDEVAPVILPV
jgi:hypothetical protein